jgi:hypothetical protein
MSSELPEPVQAAVRDLAKRAGNFVERAETGGSWIQLQTWLISMRPGYDALLQIPLDAYPRSARMTIDPERIEQILRDFTVPDSPEGGS